MNSKHSQTISLKEFGKNITRQERRFVETEKKYYQIVIELRKTREGLGLTQEKLARLAKVPRTTITKVESGYRNATLDTLISIAQAMGKNVELKLS